MLHTDRFIKIFVAESPKPYLIPRSMLSSISEYFKRALANGDRFAGEEGVMRFPEDDPMAWETRLFWKFRGEVQCARAEDDDDAKIMQLVRCWILGHKCDVNEFQNLIMLELLNVLVDAYAPYESIKVAFENTPENSPLRTLMGREAVASYHAVDEYDAASLKMFDGVQGFMTEFMKAVDFREQKNNDNGVLRTRLDNEAEWQELMVGEGFAKHWIWDW